MATPSTVDSFFFNDEGAALDHCVNGSDVFANHAQGYELDRTEEEEAHYNGGYPDGEVIPKK